MKKLLILFIILQSCSMKLSPTGGLNHVQQKQAKEKRNLYLIPVVFICSVWFYSSTIPTRQ